MNNYTHDILDYFKEDPAALPELKGLLSNWADKDTHCVFRGKILDRKYAHYLVQFLESQLNK